MDSANQSGPTGSAAAFFGQGCLQGRQVRSPGQVLCMKLQPPPRHADVAVIRQERQAAVGVEGVELVRDARVAENRRRLGGRVLVGERE